MTPGQARLQAALDNLARGKLDECPLCFEVPLSARDVRVLRCCASVMCKACVPKLPPLPGTCPFCRMPFEKGEVEDEGESPFTYTTQDYTVHSAFSAGDYSARADYTASAYVAPEYKAPDYTAPTYKAADYKAPEYKAKSYTASEYKAPDYSARNCVASGCSSSESKAGTSQDGAESRTHTG